MTLAAHLRRFIRDDSGASALEFALIAIPAVFFTFGLIEFARILFLQQNLAFAVDRAARMIYLTPTAAPSVIEAELRNQVYAIDPAALSIQVLSAVSVGNLTERRVSVQYHFNFLIPTLLPQGVDLSASRSVVIGVAGS